MRSEGGDEDLEGSLVLLLLVDASGPLFCALCVMFSRSALVSSLLGPSAGDAMGIMVIGRWGISAEEKQDKQTSVFVFAVPDPRTGHSGLMEPR